jgi:hypothetical protein
MCRSICMCVCVSVCLSLFPSACQCACLCVCLFITLSVCLSVCRSLYRSASLPVSVPVYVSVCLSLFLSACLCVGLSICFSASSCVSECVSVSSCPSLSLRLPLVPVCVWHLCRYAVWSRRHPTNRSTDGQQPIPLVGKVCLASLAGAVGGLAGNPADVVNVRMQVCCCRQTLLRAYISQSARFRRMGGCLRLSAEITAQHSMGLPTFCAARSVRAFSTRALSRSSHAAVQGAAALYRGWAPNTIRAVLMTTGQLASYDQAQGCAVF